MRKWRRKVCRSVILDPNNENFSSQVWWWWRERWSWEISNWWRPLQTLKCPVYHWWRFWSCGGGRNQWLDTDLGNEAFRIKLFISLKSSALLNNVNYSFQIKEYPAFKSHKNIIFSILSTIYQHFLSVESKIFFVS